jgi:hypothetical protein
MTPLSPHPWYNRLLFARVRVSVRVCMSRNGRAGGASSVSDRQDHPGFIVMLVAMVLEALGYLGYLGYLLFMALRHRSVVLTFFQRINV